MAAGDHTVTGTMTANKVAVTDTVVVTNLNADRVDGADKDIDGTLAGNSDSSISTEKAVKTYVDAHKNTETAGVHGSASAATASKLMHRDASGRSKVAAPAAADDIARKDNVDAVQTNLNTHGALTVAGTHGSTVAATANKVVHRDAAGRAKVVAPAAEADIALKSTVSDLAGAGRTTETVKANTDALVAGAVKTYLKGQGAGSPSIFQKLALGDTGIKIGSSNRSTAGDQVIAGVGFRPSIVVFLACDATANLKNRSWGFDDGVNPRSMLVSNDGTNNDLSASYSIYIDRAGANTLTGLISALGADGFTITWALTGTCGLEFIYLCLP